ncbi:hypothetical protein GF386_03970 [Candidatus Pacearchaeota archaeon]|nr:hypothetical protein [Candidatus Pacearchaeota archaeon]MBD3283306.1 hypothetical protein [Candidatus Pacearchaeota archaeon]
MDFEIDGGLKKKLEKCAFRRCLLDEDKESKRISWDRRALREIKRCYSGEDLFSAWRCYCEARHAAERDLIPMKDRLRGFARTYRDLIDEAGDAVYIYPGCMRGLFGNNPLVRGISSMGYSCETRGETPLERCDWAALDFITSFFCGSLDNVVQLWKYYDKLKRAGNSHREVNYGL